MNKTKIDWADMTWNPVTGCLHGCEYCYARKIANRFGGSDEANLELLDGEFYDVASVGKRITVYELNKPYIDINNVTRPYPFDFEPTFHRYRLDEPANIKKPQNIFICSMADLFGEWVPDSWIEEVYKAIDAASWHRYLFLTKNPDRYGKFATWSKPCYFGATATNQAECNHTTLIFGHMSAFTRSFISIEPIQEPIIIKNIEYCDWVIVGAETGNRKGKVIPEKSWIESVLAQCVRANVPIFMKESLRQLMGDDFIQMKPWER